MKYYIGVDVGTASVRAGVFQNDGKLVSMATRSIQIWNPEVDFYQQSTDDIWSGVIHVVKIAVQDSEVPVQVICGIGFDATCSTVALDEDGSPVTVSQTGDDAQNVILWMDHRAAEQATRINATQHPVLRYAGMKMSLEMLLPKLLWMKENLPNSWKRAAHFMDLPDFLTWRATNHSSRSCCSLVAKGLFQIVADDEGLYHKPDGWNEEFMSQIGLEDLLEDRCIKISGCRVQRPGDLCGAGLTQRAADELGLPVGTAVGSSIIDAYAGTLGCLGCNPTSSLGYSLPEINHRLVLTCGTSSCHMVVTKDAIFVPGIWGPFNSSIIPEWWTLEGGQSATGKLIDHIIQTHPSYEEVKTLAASRAVHIHRVLNDILEDLCKKSCLPDIDWLTKNLHVWPDYHGNRSPLADPTLKGMVSGLTLAASVEDLSVMYLATIQALAYGTRHIVDEMRQCGLEIRVMNMCGGLSKNPFFVRTHMNATGIPMILPGQSESVLLGAAMLGAAAARGSSSSITSVMREMGGEGMISFPDKTLKEYHDKKYKVFLKMVTDQREYRLLMVSNGHK